MNGKNIIILLLFVVINIAANSDYCIESNEDNLKSIMKLGVVREIAEKNISKAGWHIVSGLGMIKGIAKDTTIESNGKTKIVRYNVETKVYFNGINDNKLIVEYRKCGVKYILYRYCLTSIYIGDRSCLLKIFECFSDSSTCKGIYGSYCEPSINVKTKRDTIFDSLLSDFMRKSK